MPRLLLACLIILVVQGCATRSSGLQRPDRLIIARSAEPVSLNPLYLQGSDGADIGALGYSYLTKYDANGAIVADVATVVPTVANRGISSDGKTIVYRLRPGITWQDGYPLTARDIVFTYHASTNPLNALPSEGGYSPITRVYARDSHTVVVELKRPYAPIVTDFFGGDGNPILPAHLLAAYANLNHATFNGAPIGSGPYRFTTWIRGERLDLTANDRYYGTKPAIRYISIRFIHDHSTIVNELITHEVNATFLASPSNIAAMRSIPNHRVIITRRLPLFQTIVFNLSDPVLRDLSVRRAFALAIDRDTLGAKATLGLFDADNGMRGMFTWAYDPRAGKIAYDPAWARVLLAKDGWLAGSDGIRIKNGHRLEMQLIFWAQSFAANRVVPMLIEEARAVGIDLAARGYAWSQLNALDGPLFRGRFQVALLGLQNNADPDPSSFLSCQNVPPNGFNFARYCSEEVEHALRRGLSVYDRAYRRRIYSFIQQRLIADVPYDFLWEINEIDVIPSALRGYEPSAVSPYNSVAQWSLQE